MCDVCAKSTESETVQYLSHENKRKLLRFVFKEKKNLNETNKQTKKITKQKPQIKTPKKVVK